MILQEIVNKKNPEASLGILVCLFSKRSIYLLHGLQNSW